MDFCLRKRSTVANLTLLLPIIGMSIALPPIADLCFIGVNNLCYILIMPGQRFFTPNVGMVWFEFYFLLAMHKVSYISE